MQNLMGILKQEGASHRLARTPSLLLCGRGDPRCPRWLNLSLALFVTADAGFEKIALAGRLLQKPLDALYSKLEGGPLAQLAERLVDVEEVTGSSPVQPNESAKNRQRCRFFAFGSGELWTQPVSRPCASCQVASPLISPHPLFRFWEWLM